MLQQRVSNLEAPWRHLRAIDDNLDVLMFRFRFQQGPKNPDNSLSYSSGRVKVIPSASFADFKTLDAASTNTRKPHLSFAMDVYIHILYYAGELLIVYRLFRDLHPLGWEPLLRYKAPEPQKPVATSHRRTHLQPVLARLQ